MQGIGLIRLLCDSCTRCSRCVPAERNSSGALLLSELAGCNTCFV